MTRRSARSTNGEQRGKHGSMCIPTSGMMPECGFRILHSDITISPETTKEISMKRRPIVAALLSLVIPGLGQMYRGEGTRGACILVAAIAIANLNILILPALSLANPVLPPPAADARALWAYWIPRVVHDVASFWSIAFWLWAVVDAFIRRNHTHPELHP